METELKLDYAAADRDALVRALWPDGADAPRRLVSTYHDTADGDLRRAGLTLRVREAAGQYRQTVKGEGAAAAGLFARPEWEQRVPDATPVAGHDGPVAAIVGDRPLAPRFVTAVDRVAGEVERDGARIEAAVDAGTLDAGGATRPIAELELELRDGPVASLFALARTLDAAVPLRLAVASKADRGHRLADGEGDGAARAEPVSLDPDGDAAHAFAAIAHACLRHFRLNEARLLAGEEGAATLHQARVAIRRLRSALSLFAPILADDPRTDGFAAALRALAATLGRVRDLDVLQPRCEGAVRERLAEARAAALADALAVLRARETRLVMIDLAEWLAIGAWRTMAAGRRPAPAFAADLLDRRRKRIKRRGARLAALDEHDRHQVRIAAKKLRYAAEFFAGLWTGRKARRRHAAFAAAVEAVQEELGVLNDAATARATLARLGLGAAAPPAVDDGATIARAQDALDTLVDVKRFWR